MKHFLFCSLLFVGVTNCAGQTQDDFAAGLIFDDEVYDTLARQAPEDGVKTELPLAVDLSPYCPEVRHQGHILSCVGWAAGYGALSIQRAILNRCTDREVINRHAHSALFLYNQIKPADCRQGSRISDAMQFLSTQGDCLAGQFDFDINDCSQQPDTVISQQARRFAIQDFMTLFGANDSPDHKIERVKRAIARHKPVVIGMLVLRNFYQLKNAEYWHPDLGNTSPAGGHALVVVGYDERREAFRLFNSWGKNWGDEGYIWVKYRDFGQFCKYAYIMYLLPTEARLFDKNEHPEVPEKPLTRLSGSLVFRTLTGWQEQSGHPVFENTTVAGQGALYHLNRNSWPVGQLFQLLLHTLREEEYLYVFSVDAQKQVHFHWPRQAVLDKKFAGQNESGLLLADGAELIIPGPARALKLAHPGTDRLVILFAKQRIETVEKLADIVSRKTGDFTQNLLNVLGPYAVPTSEIRYWPDRIGFEASTRGTGFIVPLVLEVSAQ